MLIKAFLDVGAGIIGDVCPERSPRINRGCQALTIEANITTIKKVLERSRLYICKDLAIPLRTRVK